MPSRLLSLSLLAGCATAAAQVGPPDNTVDQKSDVQIPLRLQEGAVLAGPPPKSRQPEPDPEDSNPPAPPPPVEAPTGGTRLKLDANFSSMEALPAQPKPRKGAQ